MWQEQAKSWADFTPDNERKLRGAWSDRDTNDIFAHCSLIFYYLDFKFSIFVCPSELHPLIWFFLKYSFRKKKNIRKTSQNALAPIGVSHIMLEIFGFNAFSMSRKNHV